MLENHTAQLAAIISQIKALEAEANTVKAHILDEMKAAKITSYQSPLGTVTHVTRKSYEYTKAVKDMEEQLKLKKVEEEEKGEATVKVSEYVQMKIKTEVWKLIGLTSS